MAGREGVAGEPDLDEEEGGEEGRGEQGEGDEGRGPEPAVVAAGVEAEE